ncbi:MAG: GspE/PulE family protein [Candidatus Methylomirabilales bacterium]
MKALGQRLIDNGFVTETQLNSALREQKRTGEYLGKVLCRLGYCNEEVIASTLAAQARVKYVDVAQYNLQSQAVSMVPEEFARKHHLLPLTFTGNVLVVAMANPFDVMTADELRQLVRCQVEVVATTETAILRALDRAYGTGENWQEIVEQCLRQIRGTARGGRLDPEAAMNPPVIRLIDTVLAGAVRDGATDIHLEPEEKAVRTRYRVDGLLRYGPDIPKGLQAPVISRVKIMANLDIAENRLPQDGRFTFSFGGREIDIRASTFPTIQGENVVLRILDRAQLILGLEQIGFGPEHLTTIKHALEATSGIILVTGPTGSGKTTTLYSALSALNAEERNIITIEDPIEYEIPGIRQSQVNVKAGLTFANGLRSLLRQDPDVIMVGEMRDHETVDIAIRASLTGHLVFSTIHTNDAAGAIPRLMDMGAAPFLVASSVTLIVAQRLVRVICLGCKEEVTPDPALMDRIGIQPKPDKFKFYQGKGCDKCSGTGYRGRIGAFEVLQVTPEIVGLIMERADSPTIKKAARAQGMRTMLEDGVGKALRGITTLEEVARETLTT